MRGRLDACVRGLKSVKQGEPYGELDQLCYDIKNGFTMAMDDDLNTPGALAALFEMVRAGNSLLDRGDSPADMRLMAGIMDGLAGNVLGLDLAGTGTSGDSVRGLCDVLGEAIVCLLLAAVAAGEGALHTCRLRSVRSIRKS